MIVKNIEQFNDFFASNGQNSLILTLFEDDKITQNGLDLVTYLAENIDKLSDEVHEVILNIPYEKLHKSVFEYFFKLNEKLAQKESATLKFCVKHSQTIDVFDTRSADIYWDFDTIFNANMGIDDVCSFLRSSPLSPLEMLAYIHHYISTLAPYSQSNGIVYSWKNKDQFFAGAYQKLPEVVCAGFSSLMNEIIDNLNIPELKCEILSLDILNKKKGKTESHTRCLVTIQDSKYGIDQAVFDDTTWDNIAVTEGKACYAHFAMPNNSLDDEANTRYHYSYPDKFEYAKCKANMAIVDENLSCDNYNRSLNKIDQKMIETAFFNMLSYSHSDKSFDEVYTLLKNMAKSSLEEQTKREFSGNLTREEPQLTKEQARAIFDEKRKLDTTTIDMGI